MADISWHIEATSKCILECPMCDRTWFYNKFKRRLTQDINIEHLIKFLQGTSPKINLCGNNGDPIYHADFHKLIARLKDINSTIAITTNGSGKKKEWWTKLCKILAEDDCIQFSIDGLEDTNHLYRKNAKWDTIIDAIKEVTTHKVKTMWKFIVFKHNQHQIKDAEKTSKLLGIDEFKVIKSDRWWETDLMPSEEYVDPLHEHQLAVTQGTDKPTVIKQRCMSDTDGTPDTDLYIDSDGDFYPCCKMGLYAFRYKSIFSPKVRKYNIKDSTIDEILATQEVKDFFQSTKSYQTAEAPCKIYCGTQESIV